MPTFMENSLYRMKKCTGSSFSFYEIMLRCKIQHHINLVWLNEL